MLKLKLIPTVSSCGFVLMSSFSENLRCSVMSLSLLLWSSESCHKLGGYKDELWRQIFSSLKIKLLNLSIISLPSLENEDNKNTSQCLTYRGHSKSVRQTEVYIVMGWVTWNWGFFSALAFCLSCFSGT